MPGKTTNYKLNKPLANENVDIGVLNENMDIVDTNLKAVDTKAVNAASAASSAQSKANSAYTLAGNKANKMSVTTYILLTTGWVNNVYDLSSAFPNADITIELNGDSATEGQIEAWSNAKIRGSATSNKCYCSEVPTVDLPIIVRSVVI